jgi:predicted Zn-dependent protease
VAHTSIDWLWSFPGLIAPAIALAGIASAPAARSSSVVPPAISRSAAAVLALCAIALIPLFVSARLVTAAQARAAADPAGAREQLERAAELNPFTDRPYLLAADIAARQGESEAALAALERGREREPGEWLNYALATQFLLSEDPKRAARELRRARELNPGEEDLNELERLLRRSSSSGDGRPPRN